MKCAVYLGALVLFGGGSCTRSCSVGEWLSLFPGSRKGRVDWCLGG